jgi:hypothetical protein
MLGEDGKGIRCSRAAGREDTTAPVAIVREIAMFAWRARIGLLNPTHRGKSFHFSLNRALDGVEIVPTFVGFRRSHRPDIRGCLSTHRANRDDRKAVNELYAMGPHTARPHRAAAGLPRRWLSYSGMMPPT